MYYGWFHHYYLHGVVNSATDAAGDAASSARSARSTAERMADSLDRQALIIRTLLTFCEKKGLFNEQEFRELMNEIDLSDGQLDGKFRPQHGPQTCPSCGKTNGKRAVSCMYCGTQLDDRPVM
jgi:hypothetical protein